MIRGVGVELGGVYDSFGEKCRCDMRITKFLELRQLNFMLWVAAVVTTWTDVTRLPVTTVDTFGGMIVSLFMPRARKPDSALVVSGSGETK